MFGTAIAASKAPKMSAPRPVGGQSAYNAPRSGGPMMKGIPQPQGSFSGPAGVGPMAMPKAPMGMATRPPVIANKARGTMASHFRQEVKNALPQAAAYFNR